MIFFRDGIQYYIEKSDMMDEPCEIYVGDKKVFPESVKSIKLIAGWTNKESGNAFYGRRGFKDCSRTLYSYDDLTKIVVDRKNALTSWMRTYLRDDNDLSNNYAAFFDANNSVFSIGQDIGHIIGVESTYDKKNWWLWHLIQYKSGFFDVNKGYSPIVDKNRDNRVIDKIEFLKSDGTPCEVIRIKKEDLSTIWYRYEKDENGRTTSADGYSGDGFAIYGFGKFKIKTTYYESYTDKTDGKAIYDEANITINAGQEKFIEKSFYQLSIQNGASIIFNEKGYNIDDKGISYEVGRSWNIWAYSSNSPMYILPIRYENNDDKISVFIISEDDISVKHTYKTSNYDDMEEETYKVGSSVNYFYKKKYIVSVQDIRSDHKDQNTPRSFDTYSYSGSLTEICRNRAITLKDGSSISAYEAIAIALYDAFSMKE